jgi:peptidoglycan/LPS O-acetylase OafA/YrhL
LWRRGRRILPLLVVVLLAAASAIALMLLLCTGTQLLEMKLADGLNIMIIL